VCIPDTEVGSGVAFGQQTGLPATAKQVQELLACLLAAGHDGFRDARGPMSFTQRQAGGKFTRDEAAAFIDQLTDASQGAVAPAPDSEPARPAASNAPSPRPTERLAPADAAIRRIDSTRLAAELRRRGWTLTEPESPG